MSRFKQLWLSFYRQNRGFGMIEAAILLPLFLIITFGVIEFGNMYMARYQSRDVASSVGDYLQGKPSASSEDLKTFVTNLGFGSLKNTGPGEGNNVFAKINIQSGKTMLTAAQFDTLCSGGGVKSYANPWLGGDPSDDKNDYYIHICYPYTYNTITPISGLTVGAVPKTKTMKNKALAYIRPSFGDVTCSKGQAIVGFSNGKFTCGNAGNNYSFSCRVTAARGGAGGAVSPTCGPNEVLVGGGGDCGWTRPGVADGLVNMSRPSNHWNAWLYDCDYNPSSGGVGAGNYAFGVCCSLIKN